MQNLYFIILDTLCNKWLIQPSQAEQAKIFKSTIFY